MSSLLERPPREAELTATRFEPLEPREQCRMQHAHLADAAMQTQVITSDQIVEDFDIHLNTNQNDFRAATSVSPAAPTAAEGSSASVSSG